MCVSPSLITERFQDVSVVSELRSVSAQQSISAQDGNSSQNERCKQVGVDVVPGAVQLPADITHVTVPLNVSQQCFTFSQTVKAVAHTKSVKENV